ncbi:hypothetical protein GLOIN_2v1553339 [Rhizophagus clarus]|uniref:Uncharacterized protein n=1 Tax=Rhizophagus clarus TaxID=94130 RepID=A0A8H3QL34_9GLOM|nr:hypothetical protein GLOIN_2v1553339 [Rhizophagus clarus]
MIDAIPRQLRKRDTKFVSCTGQTIGDPYIQAFTGSIKAGNPFTITAANVPTPSNLSNPYIIRVLVADPLDQETILIYGCANATIGEALGEEA